MAKDRYIDLFRDKAIPAFNAAGLRIQGNWEKYWGGTKLTWVTYRAKYGTMPLQIRVRQYGSDLTCYVYAKHCLQPVMSLHITAKGTLHGGVLDFAYMLSGDPSKISRDL